MTNDEVALDSNLAIGLVEKRSHEEPNNTVSSILGSQKEHTAEFLIVKIT